MCRVSIIVPLYNGEKTIGRCLDSLICQELREIEILVVDDGSTDGGAAAVRSYMARDPRIRLLVQDNQGQGAARNAGLSHANGKYVGFVDCDDFVRQDMFRLMVSALERSGAPVAVCQEQNVYPDGDGFSSLGGTSFHVRRETEVAGSTALGWLLDYRYLTLNSMCYKVAERRLFEEYDIRFPQQHRYAEDLVASVRVLAAAKKVVLVPETLYYYVHEKGSFTYRYSLKNAKDIYLDWQEALSCLFGSSVRLNTDNFSLGMQFNSLKQIYWSPDKAARGTKECRELLEQWRQARGVQRWRPRFVGTDMPFMHRLKVLAAWLHLSRPMLAAMRRLQWIPLFRYLT